MSFYEFKEKDCNRNILTINVGLQILPYITFVMHKYLSYDKYFCITWPNDLSYVAMFMAVS